MNTNTKIRLATLVAFAYFFCFGSSGPFMFDNTLNSRYTANWEWEWSSQFETCYEWLVFAAIITGFFLFTLRIPAGINCTFTIRHIFMVLTVASLVALLISVELRDYNSQRAIAEEFERHGGHICFSHSSAIFSGYWHERITVPLGISCSALGVALTLLDKSGFSPVANIAR